MRKKQIKLKDSELSRAFYRTDAPAADGQAAAKAHTGSTSSSLMATAPSLKAAGKVPLRSRNNNDFTSRYPEIVSTLSALPDDTVIDVEVVALDEAGKPSFNLLQNYWIIKGFPGLFTSSTS
jgi:hypothetical protein